LLIGKYSNMGSPRVARTKRERFECCDGRSAAGLHRQGRIGRPLAHRSVVELHVRVTEHRQDQCSAGGGNSAAAIGDHRRLGQGRREQGTQLGRGFEAVVAIDRVNRRNVDAAGDVSQPAIGGSAGTRMLFRSQGVQRARTRIADSREDFALADDVAGPQPRGQCPTA